MADFSIDPAFAEQLEWIRGFVRTEIEPLDLALAGEDGVYDRSGRLHAEVIRPLQQVVKDRGLWSCHLTPEFGGQGYGQVRLAYMNEILGRSQFAPMVFGSQAPDSGNAEILAHYGTDEQRATYLAPLLDGRISSCYSMTEPQGGADPSVFTTRAVRDGDEWVIDGEKWFSSSMRFASFVIVMAITDPEVSVHKGMSMFLVPTDTPGLEVVRTVGVGGEPEGHGGHAYVRYAGVRVPAENLLGGEGNAFVVAQTRLGGGRLHHAMRTVGAVSRCLDMLCERALSRTTQGELLARKQATQEKIADSWIELTQFRLQVLHAAWRVDQVGGHAARKEIAGVKVATPKVYREAVLRTMQLHGALGVSNEMPLAGMLMASVVMGIADGPTEVHKGTLAREVLKEHRPAEGDWPSEHLPDRRAAARAELAELLEHAAAEH
ncbi:MAG: acyl-CoA dehydrogenase family protein [Acidobacteria bacterium]|nr:acyl-CoA dehydrogenase family protein [Acidobacteriota bacterium]